MGVDTARLAEAEERHAPGIAELVQRTVREVYPRYYRQEVVDAFCRLHSAQAVLEDIRQGGVYGLWLDGELIGTGSRRDCHITRVYVSPALQGRGYGSRMMDKLEGDIARGHAAARLEASLPACLLYEHRGYRTIRHDQWHLESDVTLVYEIMEKALGGGGGGARYGP